jgi:hypothetical protein
MVQARTAGVRHIGAVLEGARNLYWRLSAEENLRYFGALRLTPRRELARRIDELLTPVWPGSAAWPGSAPLQPRDAAEAGHRRRAAA